MLCSGMRIDVVLGDADLVARTGMKRKATSTCTDDFCLGTSRTLPLLHVRICHGQGLDHTCIFFAVHDDL